ncbi:major capsid protein [Rhizobium phage RHph_TM39]|nr:major capsid protein [Rhizobium phage RHph_TM40]QIG77322.1 major capsid protein [Rhizobium phage RHph_TM39]
MSDISIAEQLKGQKVEKDAERYLKQYRTFVESLESKSVLSKVRSITAQDVYALGKQLESFEVYKALCEEDGTLAQLGKIPNVAFDVITVAYGTSPLSAIASVQPIDEERGTVYYKNVIAQTTRGNVTAGQMIAGATDIEQVAPQGFAGDRLTMAPVVTVDAQLAYNITISNPPIRPGSLTVETTVTGLPACIDDGLGNILGRGISGTVNYTTGAVVLNFAANPTAGKNIVLTFATDFEASTDIPKILFKLDTKSVNARVFALKDTIGLEQSYALRRRFGMIAEDEVATDLVSAINAETVNTGIAQLAAKAIGNVNWSKTAPDGVSYFEHKQSLKDQLSVAEANILSVAGRGTVNVMIAGRNAAAIIQTLPGFVKISDGSTIGPHIFGTLDGMTVVRVPNGNVLNADTILCMYNAVSPFESALVYAPYMPLVVTSALPGGVNPLINQRAAAVWAAIDVLVPNFITKITITA